MSKLRQILKLHKHHQGTRVISEITQVSRNTVKKYLSRLRALKTTMDELFLLTDAELDGLFNIHPLPEPSQKLLNLYNFFPNADKRLRQPGMTLHLLWKEYTTQHVDAYQTTAFYRHYDIWKKRSHPSLRMIHKAGDKVFVDYAGEKLKLVDPQTGKIVTVEVYVAILGSSQLTYAEAVESQGMEDFIMASQNALHYFGGSPAAIVPDNLKSAVIKSSRYEPQLNENFSAFAEHYGMVVLPARAYKPKDKSLVEGAVKIVYNRIYTNLEGKIFTSLIELNQAILKYLEEHNHAIFQGRNYSRRQQFEEMEKQTLQPLPIIRYEIKEQTMVTVMKNGHVCLNCDRHYYSVPFEHIGKKVKLLYSKSLVEIYFKLILIASHERVKSPHQYTTDKEHMATYYRYITEWNPDRFIKDAYEIHNHVGSYIEQVISRKSHPEQAYKSCQGILSFARRVGSERLVKACERAHSYNQYHYKIIETILSKNLDQFEVDEVPDTMPGHDNIRGEDYYK